MNSVSKIPPAYASLFGKESEEKLEAFYAELRQNPPFSLKLVNKNGTTCHSYELNLLIALLMSQFLFFLFFLDDCRCSWYKYCVGCEFTADSPPLSDGMTIAVDWHPKTLRSYYDSDRAEKYVRRRKKEGEICLTDHHRWFIQVWKMHKKRKIAPFHWKIA